MLSEKLCKAFNAQINAEMWSAYLYLSMSMDAAAKGHKGIANWFKIQFQEEQAHAEIMMNHVLARGNEVVLAPIDAVQTSWVSALEMYKDTLTHEKKVTSLRLLLRRKIMQLRTCLNGSLMSKLRKRRVLKTSSTN